MIPEMRFGRTILYETLENSVLARVGADMEDQVGEVPASFRSVLPRISGNKQLSEDRKRFVRIRTGGGHERLNQAQTLVWELFAPGGITPQELAQHLF
jgi:hypothetical protein